MNKSIYVIIAAGVALSFGFAGCTKKDHEGGSTTEASSGADACQGALKCVDTQVGSGATAESGTMVSVHYTGKLTDGTVFDSSVSRGQPFSFQLGAGQVIQGWEQGIQGMKVGGKRTLTIPPELAYGDRAVGPIPANSTLTFDVELLDVKKP